MEIVPAHPDVYASFGLDETFAELGVRDAELEAGEGPLFEACEPISLDELSDVERRGDDPGRHAPPTTLGAGPLELAAGAWPLARDCSTQYRARRTSGTRRLSSIRLGVVHCTQGATALGAASWFANPKSQGSAHLCVDGMRCYRTLPPSIIPWGASGVNATGWHLELAGFAERTRTEWLRNGGTLERGAYKLAQNGAGRFPMRFLTDAQLAAAIRGDKRVRGICSHRQVSRVHGGSHWDPGSHFPWDVFMGLARKFEAAL